MPIAGRLYTKLSPAVMAGVGVLFTATGQFFLAGMTLSSGAGQIMSSLVLQGVGMSLMMVPLQTIALSTIPRERLADATGLSSLLRQIGGSLGIALFATSLTRQGVVAGASVRAHLVAERPEVATQLAATRAGLMARGMDFASAQSTALRSFAGKVAQQGMVLAFEQVFLLGVLLFVAILPLILLLRRPKQGAAAPAHIEME